MTCQYVFVITYILGHVLWAPCRVLVGVDSDHYSDMLLCVSALAFQAALSAAAPAKRDQPYRLQRGSQQLSPAPLSQ